MHSILIIEDDRALNTGISLALRGDGMSFDSAYDLAGAAALIERNDYDLILLDVNLPDGSGFDFLEYLRCGQDGRLAGQSVGQFGSGRFGSGPADQIVGRFDGGLPGDLSVDRFESGRPDDPATSRIKRWADVPVILLTANDLETDIVSGLALGADDYITKPFSLAVLRARVQVQLRNRNKYLARDGGNDRDGWDDHSRESHGEGACGVHNYGKDGRGSLYGAQAQMQGGERDGSAAAASVFCMGEYEFDFQKLRFFGPGGEVVLSRTEQKLLRILVENRGNVVSRERLLSWVWDDGADFVEENALSVAVKRLRDKLDGAEVIRTVYGIGYIWEDRDGRQEAGREL